MLRLGPVYIWRLCNGEHERQSYRSHLVRCFLEQPAYTEVMLARLQHLEDIRTREVSTPSSPVLDHRGIALSMLHRKLQDPSSAFEAATLSIIIATLILDQQLEDWDSFRTNAYGLHRIIALHGGLDALQRQNPRAFTIVRELDAMYQNRPSPVVQLGRDGSGADSPVVQCQISTETADFRVEGSRLPLELFCLYKSGQLGSPVMIHLQHSFDWLRLRSAAAESPPEERQALFPDKQSLEIALSNLLNTSTLQNAERFICTGMLILIAMPSLDDSSRRTIPLDLSAVNLVGKLERIIASRQGEGKEKVVERHVLWTAFAVAGMPVDAPISYNKRWSLIHHCLRKDASLSRWATVERVLGDIYLDDALRLEWKRCWHIAQAHTRQS